MEQLVKAAQKKAKLEHKTQNYNGKPYYEAHLLPVADLAVEIAKAQGVKSKEDLQTVEICALLHDVVEDSATVGNAADKEAAIQQELDKIEKTFNKNIREVVDLLTYRKGEEKSRYLQKISKNKIAKIVKVADRCFNISKLPEVNEKQKLDKLVNKYSNDMEYFFEFNIFPEIVDAELKKALGILKKNS